MLTRWIKKSVVALTATLLLSQTAQAAAPLVMATKSFTEQHILSAMTVLWLQKKGFEVVPKRNIATTIGRNALLNKQIDMVWEYTGTSLIIFNHINQPMSSQQAYETVKKLDARLGLVWLNPAPMNNTYAFAMTRERAEKEASAPCRSWLRRLNRCVKPTRSITGDWVWTWSSRAVQTA